MVSVMFRIDAESGYASQFCRLHNNLIYSHRKNAIYKTSGGLVCGNLGHGRAWDIGRNGRDSPSPSPILITILTFGHILFNNRSVKSDIHTSQRMKNGLEERWRYLDGDYVMIYSLVVWAAISILQRNGDLCQFLALLSCSTCLIKMNYVTV